MTVPTVKDDPFTYLNTTVNPPPVMERRLT